MQNSLLDSVRYLMLFEHKRELAPYNDKELVRLRPLGGKSSSLAFKEIHTKTACFPEPQNVKI